ncbi:MAG: hypothetical protein J2P57_16415 [Acidimicrobiaceae bacterium]|nr:hypothetical protein [Acidimicrobiaceae bacterium]
MTQIHANLSMDAAHGWNGLAVRLGVSTSGLLEAVGQLLADETRPLEDALYENLAERARSIDAKRRQRKVRLLQGLVPVGAGSAAIARVARVAVHRPIASASAGMLALGAIGGGAVIIDRAPGVSSRAAAAPSGSSDAQLPTAKVLGDDPPNVLPVPAAASPVATAPPATATATAPPAAVPPNPVPPAPVQAAPAPPPTSSPSASVNAGPVSASASVGSSGAQVNAQTPVASAQATVTPSSASVGAQTPVANATVSAQTGAVSQTMSSATSGTVGAVKKVAGSVLGG